MEHYITALNILYLLMYLCLTAWIHLSYCGCALIKEKHVFLYDHARTQLLFG